ncbi:MAG: SpoIIE family protein phosphatase, partial [Synergistaceae bacterium]|nr:SpoIIE family protein phosphatase [Synergistaceae bacterium]
MRTIKSKMTLVTVCVISLLALLISLLTGDVRARYKELEVEACQALVLLEYTRLEAITAQLKDNVVKMAILGEVYHQMEGKSLGFIRSALIEYFRDHSLAVGGGIWYEPRQLDPERERVCFYVFRGENGLAVDKAFEDEEYDYHSKQWYIELKRQLESGESKTAWSSPYVDGVGTFSLMLTVGSGIFDESGKLLGLSTLDWQLDDIARHISSIRPTPGSFVLVADLDDDYILTLSDGLMTESSAERSLVGQPLSALTWFDKSQMDNDTNVIEGRKYLSFSAMLEHEMFFLINVPEDELFENIERHSRRVMLLLFAACVTISALIRLLLNHFVNKPLDYLSRKAEEIGAGNLTTSIQLNTRDELGSLAKTLERMTADIREYISRLNTAAAELAVAAEIQASMLPSVPPSFSGRGEFDVRASMLPAKEVGGDFYDFFMLDDGRLAVLVADVSDKGVPAALFMVVARTLIRNAAHLDSDLGGVFAAVNNRLCENNKVGMFVTAFMAVLDLSDGTVTCVNAGHNQPCIRQAGARFEFLKTRAGFVLGGMENTRYTEERLRLDAGDCLFLYTDGVTEAENSDGDFFGNERLLKALDRQRES